MRFLLSMTVLMMAFVGFSSATLAQEAQSASPLQAQLQKMQSGETYGMKTAVVAPASPATPPPKEGLNENAKALAEKATEQSAAPTRLQLVQDAYKKAALPAAEPPSDKAPAETKPDVKKTAPADNEVMFEMIQAEKPKVPQRLIPVN